MCAATGVGGYNIHLDGALATSAADGTFSIASPTSSNVTWSVDGMDIETSQMAFSLSTLIPIVKSADYIDLQNNNGITQVGATGDVFVRVVHGGTPVATVAGTVTPTAVYNTLYDGTTKTDWSVTGTGTYGMVWFAGITTGAAALTLTPQGSNAIAVPNVPVGDSTITWITLNVP
ncbi:MAG: hypothetical protein QM831_04080 [Kofleriaceae bacterium]